MFDSEYSALKREEHHIIFQKYNDTVEELKRELEACKTEQNGIRSELQALYVDNKNSSDVIRDYISRVHVEECGDEDARDKMIANLKERIALLQMEKDSAVQLWQVSMKAIDALEQELRTRPTEKDSRTDVKYYEEQLKDVRQSYSEAIKALENKLLQTKENFARQQSLWTTSQETIETLKREKHELTRRLEEFQQSAQQKDRNSQQTIQSLTEELIAAKAEAQRVGCSKTELERKLNESRRVAHSIMTKNEETKCKMAEALDLIESAVREKDLALEREARVAEQNARLEARLAAVTEEHIAKMRDEIAKLREAHEHNVRKYLVEIKSLKSELRERMTTTVSDNRSQTETRLEEDLMKVRHDSEELLGRSAATILNLEQTLKQQQADTKDGSTGCCCCGETCEKRCGAEMRQLREKIGALEETLTESNEKLRQLQQQNSASDMRDRLQVADEKTKAAIDRYVTLESELVRATDDKESLATEFRSLQSALEREIHKRDYERRTLEGKIRELETGMQKSNVTDNQPGVGVPMPVSSVSQADVVNKHTLDIRVENMDGHNWQSLLAEQLRKQQETFDKKIKEMMQHVTVHQKLSRRWRDEAKSLTARFQTKTKDLRGKINSLRKENAELQKALLLCRQVTHKTDNIHSYVQQGSETR